MTDENAPVRRAHRAALGHLAGVHARREAARERAERYLTGELQRGAQPPPEPQPEVEQ